MKKLTFRTVWSIIKLSIHYFAKEKITKRSAALAYYTIFSLPGMLLIIITASGALFGEEAIVGTLHHKIQGFVGNAAASQIQDWIRNAAVSGESTIAGIVGIAALIYGATKMFSEIQDSINLIWHLQAKPKKGWLRLIINRLISFSMVITLAFLLLVSFIINGLVMLLSNYLISYFPEATLTVAYIINMLLSFIITVILFAIIFKVLPDARIRWSDVTVGAVVTSILFTAGKFLIGLYLKKSNIGSTYGTAGSIIIILLWIYYSAIILYYGATFTKAYSQHIGHHIYPVNAVWTKQIEVGDSTHLQKAQPPVQKDRET